MLQCVDTAPHCLGPHHCENGHVCMLLQPQPAAVFLSAICDFEYGLPWFAIGHSLYWQAADPTA
jgi:hypothetical protein